MLRYSRHAEQRMRERRISKDIVEAVVDSPDVTYPDGGGNRCLVRDVDGRTVRVVLAGDDPDFVVTVIAVTRA